MPPATTMHHRRSIAISPRSRPAKVGSEVLVLRDSCRPSYVYRVQISINVSFDDRRRVTVVARATFFRVSFSSTMSTVYSKRARLPFRRNLDVCPSVRRIRRIRYRRTFFTFRRDDRAALKTTLITVVRPTPGPSPSVPRTAVNLPVSRV